MENIPEKLEYLETTKALIKNKIESTGQNADVPLSEFPELIRNIPNTGAITYSQIDEFTRQAIEINGEKA